MPVPIPVSASEFKKALICCLCNYFTTSDFLETHIDYNHSDIYKITNIEESEMDGRNQNQNQKQTKNNFISYKE